MRVLVIAPQPFYEERGTPIATKVLVEALRAEGHEVDILTCHLGTDPGIDGVQVFRAPGIPFVREIPIGFSFRKLACDALIGVRLLTLARRRRYDVLHAVEEAVFLSLAAKLVCRGRVVYDMDSSLVEQLLAGHRLLRPLSGILCRFERFAIARSDLVLAVCNDLAERARAYRTATPVGVAEDVPMLQEAAADAAPVENLRAGLAAGHLLALYVGNLEHYQGVGLMLEALARLGTETPLRLVVIGGSAAACEAHRAQARRLGIDDSVRFVGARPLANLRGYLDQADILVSPRLTGHNTPMKLYSYLAAGKPILATRIRSHTQVLDDATAKLVAADAAGLAQGLEALLCEPGTRIRLGQAAAELAATRYSIERFRSSVSQAYSQLARATAG